ncbi:expressed protein [Phakopsora pachyrhizi]|uniref:Expressed protein n=1 Tax=Phakopsora pachyrhizi TaxID=170000 RepID=A0AAV0AMD4_PHAPC|nr:expressed protein [Phakopsora pachyrhizi]
MVDDFYISQQKPSQMISPSQVSILKILDSSITPSPTFLIRNFLKLSSSSSVKNSRLINNQLDKNCKEEENLWNGFYLICEMIVRWIERSDERGHLEKDDKEGVEDQDICRACGDSLEILKKLQASMTKSRQPETDKRDGIGESMELKVKIVLIKVLSSLCSFRRATVQDLIREKDGIRLIFGFTGLDVDQPCE